MLRRPLIVREKQSRLMEKLCKVCDVAYKVQKTPHFSHTMSEIVLIPCSLSGRINQQAGEKSLGLESSGTFRESSFHQTFHPLDGHKRQLKLIQNNEALFLDPTEIDESVSAKVCIYTHVPCNCLMF